MRAREVMTQGVVSVPPDLSAADALHEMRTRQIHHLIVGSAAKPLGVVSARDLGGRGSTASRQRPVEELMSTPIVTVDVNDSVRRVANMMRGRSIGCVIVTDRRRVAGIITVSDLLELLGRGLDRAGLAPAERRGLHHRVPHRRSSGSSGVW